MAEESSRKVLKSKRLFVGGLNHGVSKEELRMKFEPFGNVKDLEMITRKDDSGVPLKTFAYINIEVSEKDLKKCLTIYNNCNWKGNVLKIQLAKEDYLSRLQKEKTLKSETRKSDDILDNSVVPDIKSAVPGTPVPGKRNWVVGKFGRSLPIVFLRRKDGKKVAKFDPSKTVHCVKKIRVGNELSQSVNTLTWDIESSCPNVCDISKSDPKKSLVNDNEGKNNNIIPRKVRRKRKDFEIGTEILCTPDVNNCGFEDKSGENSADGVDGPENQSNSEKCDPNKHLDTVVVEKDESAIPRKVRRKRKDFEIETEILCPVDVNSCGFEDKSGEKSAESVDDSENQSNSEIDSLEDGDSWKEGNDESLMHKVNTEVTGLDCRNDVNDDSEKDLSNESDLSTDDDNSLKIAPNSHTEKQNEPKRTKDTVHENKSDAAGIICNTSPSTSVSGYDRNINEGDFLKTMQEISDNNDIFSRESLSNSSSEDGSSVQNDKEYQTSSGKALMPEINVTDSSKSKHGLPNTTVDGELTSIMKEHGARPTTNSSSSLRKSDSTKREMSNSLRLESLKGRTQVIQKQKDIVRTALQKIDSDHFKGNNHLVLDENDEELKIPSEGKKITGAKALSWLGMDSASDDDGDDDDKNQNNESFSWKEYFDGKSGEKLMKLQQKFGHDGRFKMDERFLESDEELDSDAKKDLCEQTKKRSFSEVDEGDEIDRQLQEEKQLSFKVLQEVLGCNSIFMGQKDDSRNQYRDSLATHYDPSREDHAQFEENIVKPISPEVKENDIVPKKSSETELPLVTKSKFYSVSDSLKNIFEKKDQESNTFSFLTDLNENKDCKEINIIEKSEEITKWKVPVELLQNLPYDSSASEAEDEQEEPRNLSEVDSSPKKDYQRHLFYHPENKTMMDTLEEESSSFKREESIESLKKYWLQVRQNLTQDYKKKRKDALRRQKKMSHKL